jgi:poly-gamma-glutamate synthesis protein (capsule biosynthesis protein)
MSEPPVRIGFLGDTLLGGVAEEHLSERGYGYASSAIAPLLAGNALVVNHEGPLTVAEHPQAKEETGRRRYWYKGRPAAASALRDLGVAVAGLANNHVLDYGHAGLSDTIAALDAAGIAHCGAGMTEEDARRPAVFEARGVRIGVVACMQRYDIYVRERSYASGSRGGCFRLRLRTVREELEALRGRVDLRVVTVHWGRNYRGVTRRQRQLATGLVEAGADLVVGHHPHVPQPVELIHGTPVFYSLGNGMLGTPGRFHSGRAPYGLLPLIDVDGGRIAAIEMHLLAVDNAEVAFSPVPATGPAAEAFLGSLVSPRDGWHGGDGTLRARLADRRTPPHPAWRARLTDAGR